MWTKKGYNIYELDFNQALLDIVKDRANEGCFEITRYLFCYQITIGMKHNNFDIMAQYFCLPSRRDNRCIAGCFNEKGE